jgi:hypothetical protein
MGDSLGLAVRTGQELAGQPGQVLALRSGELEGGRQRVEHLRRRAGGACLLQPLVVADRHLRPGRHLLAAQTRGPPGALPRSVRPPGGLRAQVFPAAAEEIGELLSGHTAIIPCGSRLNLPLTVRG